MGDADYIFTFTCIGSVETVRLSHQPEKTKPQKVGWTHLDLIRGTSREHEIGPQIKPNIVSQYCVVCKFACDMGDADYIFTFTCIGSVETVRLSHQPEKTKPQKVGWTHLDMP